jgi:hypothetical protein
MFNKTLVDDSDFIEEFKQYFLEMQQRKKEPPFKILKYDALIYALVYFS